MFTLADKCQMSVTFCRRHKKNVGDIFADIFGDISPNCRPTFLTVDQSLQALQRLATPIRLQHALDRQQRRVFIDRSPTNFVLSTTLNVGKFEQAVRCTSCWTKNVTSYMLKFEVPVILPHSGHMIRGSDEGTSTYYGHSGKAV